MALLFGLLLGISSYSLFTSAARVTAPVKNVTDCSCGFYDHVTQNLFTDSAIVYFNETTGLPSEVFVPQDYEDGHEKGWNALYRQGADGSNVRVDQAIGASNTSLELFVDPATPAHLVVGGGIQTTRQDLFYGSFRMLLRSPGASTGSSLSMDLSWNETQAITMNVQSTDWPWTAWVSTLSGDEFPDKNLGVNYSTLANSSISPWDYTEYRVDWSPKEVNWTIGGKTWRSLKQTSGNHFPQTPVPLVLKHWSVGNWFSMQGPPVNRSVAHVGWVRMFFNSSLTTDADRTALSLRCHPTDACGMDDTTLRGASPYDLAATLKWKQIQKPRGRKLAATLILIICGSVSFLLISNALFRRLPWEKLRRSPQTGVFSSDKVHASPYAPSARLTSDEPASIVVSYYHENPTSVSSTPQLLSRRPSNERISIFMNALSQDEDIPREKRKSARLSWREYTECYQEAQPYTPHSRARSLTENVTGDEISAVPKPRFSFTQDSTSVHDKSRRVSVTADPTLSVSPGVVDCEPHESHPALASPAAFADVNINDKTTWAEMKAINSARAQATTPANLPLKKHRVDYLAGLVAMSCLIVTGIHFCLTFVPAAINPGAFVHYESEAWARRTVSSYFLNLIWIGKLPPSIFKKQDPMKKVLIGDLSAGPFLMTSTRFLVSGYLKTGDMARIAEKAVGRPFRLIIPVFAIAMLEYFFMDSGATTWLEDLPSVTWSSWPFTTVPHTFGNFLSEILELAYLIPNAAPQITFNFCTGALFTIPIQLQGSWTSLLAVIVVREIKQPWKRFAYYAFCITVHWYALSWGTYFYLALMLADLDITYKYRKWLKTQPLVYYPLVMLCVVLAFGAPSIDMATQWTGVNYVGNEYGLHPDIPTGKPIGVTGAAGYPQYYVPKAHGVLFAFGLQALVELTSLGQKIFSSKLLIWIFPHIYTIYLIHGFIFWSIGSSICVLLAGRGVHYWVNLLIVAVVCYTTLFASLPILTPIVETLGKHVTAIIWQFAHNAPAPRRPTLFPFPSNFLFVRQTTEQQDEHQDNKLTEKASTSKPRGVFRRYLASLVAVFVDPKSSKHRQSQPARPSLARTLSRSSLIGRRPTPPRNVGWRMGRLSGNVEELRRNNSSAKDNKTKATEGCNRG